MDHLEDRSVSRLAARLLQDAEEAQAWKHVAGCPDCARRVEAARAEMNAPTDVAAQGQPKREQEGSTPWPIPEAREQASPGAGSRIGRYVVLSQIGMGGMGVVFAAHDPELDRKVALKLLNPSTSDPDGQARLLREAQAMARVAHPNVMAVHDVGTYGSQIFLAMDLVEGGRTVQGWLGEAPRTWRQVLEVMLAAGRGLAAAHAAGLVHRDFKPENVLVGKDGRVMVTDFGLARLAGPGQPREELERTEEPATEAPASRLSSPLTGAGAVVGTPRYMAPEQHLNLPPDTRSDQFSFCVALYYALFGRRPFEPRQFVEAVRLGRAEGLIQPPPRAPSVPAWVKRAIMRGLSLSPEERFPSMEALLERLSRPPATVRWVGAAGLLLVLSGIGLLARYEAVQRRSALCSGAEERLKGAWDSGIERQVQTAFAATGRPYAEFTFQAVKSTLDTHAREWVGMHTEACQATRIRGEQTEAILTLRVTCLERRRKDLEALTAVLVKSDATVLDRAVDMVMRLPGVSGCADVEALSARVPPPADPVTRAEVERLHGELSRAETQMQAGNYSGALEIAGEALKAAQKISYAPLLAETLMSYGWAQVKLGRGGEAETSLLMAWRAAEEGRDDEMRVRIATDLVYTLAALQARQREALTWGALGEDALARLGHAPKLEGKLRTHLGTVFLQAGKYPEAERELTQALALSGRGSPASAFDRSGILSILAHVYQAEGNLAEAVRLQEEALTLTEQGRGVAHPESALEHNNLADVYLRMGNYALAAEHARHAMRVLEEAVGSEHLWVGMTCDTLSTTLALQGNLAEAAKYAQRALTIEEKVLGTQHPMLLGPLDNLGYVYLRTGRPQQAVPLLERALALKDPEPGPLADVRFHAAEALVASGGDRKRARELAALALDVYRSQGQREQAAEVERWLKSQ